MSSLANHQYECSKKCKNIDHGNLITHALRSSRLDEKTLAAIIAKSCRNFAGILDDKGCSALHEAAAHNKYAIVEWLINQGADVNQRNHIGITAVHRAIKSGNIHIAVLLQKYGADVNIDDDENNSHLTMGSMRHKKYRPINEALVWGSNKNYNLGIGSEEGKDSPQLLDYFQKRNICVDKIAISTYHCLYLCENGTKLYTAGHGTASQLGVGNNGTLVYPDLVKLQIKKTQFIKDISVSQKHSVVLTNDGIVYTCGTNDNYQLGYDCTKNGNKQATFKIVPFTETDGNQFKGIVAQELHTIAFTNKTVYVWGRNVGQFGVSSDVQHIAQPTPVNQNMKNDSLSSDDRTIIALSSSNAVIAYLTKNSSLCIYYKFKVRIVRSPVHTKLQQLTVSHNIDSAQTAGEDLKIITLAADGLVLIWYEEFKQYLVCVTPNVMCSNILSYGNTVWFNNGFVYKGVLSVEDIVENLSYDPYEYQALSRKDLVSKLKRVKMDIKRIPFLNRVVQFACDTENKSFVSLQQHSKACLTADPLVVDELSFKSLMLEATDNDNIHDVIIHVEEEQFIAHKYIIYSRASGLGHIIKQNQQNKHVYLKQKGLSGKMFELMLKHIYSNHKLTLTDIEDIELSLGPFSAMTNIEIFSIFREIAGQFGLSHFPNTNTLKFPSIKLNVNSFKELYDVKIQCANNQELNAHKCILISRMEYFRLMFNMNWSETSTVNFTTVPVEYMRVILIFLYSNNATELMNEHFSDSYIYNMLVICDQYFINNLREIFEHIAVQRLSLRKCIEMFEFASDFNCKYLKDTSLDYINFNIARLLDHNLLKDVDIATLECIQQRFKLSRMSDDYQYFNSDDEDLALLNFVQDFNVDLNYKLNESADKKSKKKNRTLSGGGGASFTITQERRNIEKEAITSNKALELDGDRKETNKAANDVLVKLNLEALKINEELTKKASDWTKVSDKKDIKKKVVLAGLKSNEILQTELKEKEKFVNLNKSLESPTTAAQSQQTSPNTFAEKNDEQHARSNISLASFTPLKSTKLSQKQRKNITPIKSTITEIPVESHEQSLLPTVTDSCWVTLSPPPSAPIAIPGTSSSFQNSKKRNNSLFQDHSPSTSSAASSFAASMDSSSFTKILLSEKKEKEYAEKLRNKSLALTQIEDKAIDELKKFYNVENVFDEHITVDRINVQIKPTFYAPWHQ